MHRPACEGETLPLREALGYGVDVSRGSPCGGPLRPESTESIREIEIERLARRIAEVVREHGPKGLYAQVSIEIVDGAPRFVDVQRRFKI